MIGPRSRSAVNSKLVTCSGLCATLSNGLEQLDLYVWMISKTSLATKKCQVNAMAKWYYDWPNGITWYCDAK